MKILITGICGFTGNILANELLKCGHEICGIDNLSRVGSEINFKKFKKAGLNLVKGDIRSEKDLKSFLKIDYILDCAAEPSVLAGTNNINSFDLIDNNLIGTVKLLELCKKNNAGFILLSTSRVYSIEKLLKLKLKEKDNKYEPVNNIKNVSVRGITESFFAEPPLSLYGASKRCSEILSIEYGKLFQFPVWINRCGVLSGKGQFGKADQGIFSYWIKSWRDNKELKYIGFGGKGLQTRDCLHPKDLVNVINKQIKTDINKKNQICNFAGGAKNSCSLKILSEWCEKRFGAKDIKVDLQERKFDLPWVVLDCNRAEHEWNWKPNINFKEIFEEIAEDE